MSEQKCETCKNSPEMSHVNCSYCNPGNKYKFYQPKPEVMPLVDNCAFCQLQRDADLAVLEAEKRKIYKEEADWLASNIPGCCLCNHKEDCRRIYRLHIADLRKQAGE